MANSRVLMDRTVNNQVNGEAPACFLYLIKLILMEFVKRS